jgi:hypothetical protein
MSGQDVSKNGQKSFFDRPQRNGNNEDSLMTSSQTIQPRQSRNLIFQFGISPVWQHCTQDVLVCPPRIDSQRRLSKRFAMDFHNQTIIDNRHWISITDDDLGITELPNEDSEVFTNEETGNHSYRHRS